MGQAIQAPGGSIGITIGVSKALQLASRYFLQGMDTAFAYYWEQDKDQCFSLVQFPENSLTSQDTAYYIGHTFWEIYGDFVDTTADWSRYRSLFNSRLPIQNFIVCRPDENEELYYASITGHPVYDAQGEFSGYCGVVRDVTREKRLEDYASTFELAAVGIGHVASTGKFIHVNRKLCEMLGYSREELLDRTVKQISHPEDEHATDLMRDQLRAGRIESFKIEKRYIRKDGTTMWAELTTALKRGSSGMGLYDVSVVEDITARKQAESRVQYLASHDEMTGLPNRTLFGQLLKHAVENALRYQGHFAVMFIDLDRFKHINDCLGHEAGDALLKEMARRFRGCLRASDVVARLGGDEFVVLLHEVDTENQVLGVARNLLNAAMKPVLIHGQDCRVTASIGIALFPRDGGDENTIMRNADLAMYLAKQEGKNNFQFYSEKIQSGAIEKLLLESHLRRAMDLDEFDLHFQAKVYLKTGEIRGVEALLRWNSALLGNVPPAQFIPLAEEMGLIVPIGKWVLKQACIHSMSWQRLGLPPVCASVNLSPRQFSDPDLIDDVKQVLAETGIDPSLVELEITESMVMNDADRAVQTLQEIKALGVKVAIDDFGTGYSSLSQLKRFPVDTLKVDRSFIRELGNNEEDRAITQAIITMSKTLGLNVVAEGVENAEQQTFLSAHDCDEIQGYHFSKPLPNDKFVALLQQHKPSPML
jgi:diguanylate cyclase (GGDEF)-like protein/PAS domain S-box-containing protein